MDGRKRLPDAELSVMQAVWAHGGEVSRGDIEGALASHGWSVNTINTYLTRLCDKGYLSARREGRSNFYTPLVSAGEVPRVRQPKRPAAALRRLAGQLCCGADGGKAARAERDRRAAALSG